MRYVLPVLVGLMLCALGAALSRGAAEDAADGVKADGKPPEAKPAGDDEPPLLLDHEPLLLGDEPPLLLGDDPTGASDHVDGADNSRCHVCHLSFAREELTVVHAKADVGCVGCHGDCDAHIDDESWASGGPGTPPEIMYPRDAIDPACMKCHKTHDVPATIVLKRFQERRLEKLGPKEIVCTDCHGEHRLNPKLRKAWWDKKTGEPLKPKSKP